MPTFLSDVILDRNPDAGSKAANKAYVDSVGGGGGAEEVAIQGTEPAAHPDLWVDTASSAVSAIRSVLSISTSTTLAAAASTDYVYICSAALTATLPTAVGNSNKYTVKRTGSGDVTVATTSSQTIDGASTFLIDVQYMSVDFLSDGANWVIV